MSEPGMGKLVDICIGIILVIITLTISGLFITGILYLTGFV